MSEPEFDTSTLEALTEPPVETPETPPETPVEEEVPEANPIEEKALAKGWKPQDQYQGDPDEFVDAGEFLRRQPLFDQLSKKERKIRDLERKLEGTTKFVQGIEKRVRDQTLAEIEADRRKAVEDGDVEAFEDADKRYKEAAKEPEPPKEETDNEIPEEVQAFAKRNDAWFEKNAAMTEDAVAYTKFYRGRGKDLNEALVEAEKDIKRKYADFFKNPNQERPQTVAGGNRDKGKAQRGYNDLTPEQKGVWAAMKSVYHAEGKSVNDYIKELEKQGAFE